MLHRSSADLLFPVMPTTALYILGTQDTLSCTTTSSTVFSDKGTVWIDVGLESMSDVHLRNASLLQRNPSHLYFSSLTSVVQAISSYDECRWMTEHLNYSRLKQRARQKSTLEQVTKTLLVKGSVLLVDLSDEVTKIGQDPVYHGGFSDVWKGVWTNPMGQSKVVCIIGRNLVYVAFTFFVLLVGRTQVPPPISQCRRRCAREAPEGALILSSDNYPRV